MIIAHVLKSGGVYAPEHVVSLRTQIRWFMPDVPIVCLSDIDFQIEDVRRVPLTHGWPGWWSKLELFRPGVFGKQRVVYLDLDTWVRRDLAPLAEIPGAFCALRDFYRPDGLGSGVMVFDPLEAVELYIRFAFDAEAQMRKHKRGGDQAFIEQYRIWTAARIQDHAAGVYSYKVHCKEGVPADARLVCFHGRPKPWEVAHVAAA